MANPKDWPQKEACKGFPDGTSGLKKKNLPVNAGDIKDVNSTPWSGISTGGGHGNPLQYSCLENRMDKEDKDGLQSTGSQRVGHD